MAGFPPGSGTAWNHDVKDLPKALTWQLEWDSNLRISRRKAPNQTTEPSCPTSVWTIDQSADMQVMQAS